MGHIRLLSDILASQVAAGEVVERPASVVKELVENSIDAGARRITIEFHRGGTRLICVTDDGIGMDRSDALLCLERHATSKIRQSTDLMNINTLGFRGEALPSIASVSRFRLMTRQREGETGTCIEVNGGKLVNVTDSGEAPGTRIEVSELFFNIPARRKFLRGEQTEAANLLRQIEVLAVAHPKIAFTCHRDGREVLRLASTEDLAVRLRDLHGEEFLQKLLPVPKIEIEGVSVHGWIARPGEGRTSRNLQMLFVNGRMIQSPVLSLPLREAADGILAKGLHPPAVLFFQMEPSAVDCNVHPAKREVRFHDPGLVRSVSLKAAQSAWKGAAETAQSYPAPYTPQGDVQHWKPRPISQQREFPQASPVSPFSLQPSAFSPSARVAETPSLSDGPEFGMALQAVALNPSRQDTSVLNLARFIGQLGGQYLLFEDQESLLLVEIRAARERLLYEQFSARLGTGELDSQHLLIPEVLEMSPGELAWISAHHTLLLAAGLVAEPFGTNSLKVDAIPAEAAHLPVMEIVSKLVDDLRESSDSPSLDSAARETVAKSVSRLAASGAPLPRGDEAAHALLAKLLACELPYATPSGRPTMSQISPGEMERRFTA